MNLSVCSGSLWPLVCLLLGVVAGRLFKYMQGRGHPQAQALAAVNRVEARIKAAHPDDSKVLSPTIAAARQLVYLERLETVTDALKPIEA